MISDVTLFRTMDIISIIMSVTACIIVAIGWAAFMFCMVQLFVKNIREQEKMKD